MTHLFMQRNISMLLIINGTAAIWISDQSGSVTFGNPLEGEAQKIVWYSNGYGVLNKDIGNQIELYAYIDGSCSVYSISCSLIVTVK